MDAELRDALTRLDEARSAGWRFSATTPDNVEAPEGVEFRMEMVTPGYRTWLFRTLADKQEFDRGR